MNRMLQKSGLLLWSLVGLTALSVRAGEAPDGAARPSLRDEIIARTGSELGRYLKTRFEKASWQQFSALGDAAFFPQDVQVEIRPIPAGTSVTPRMTVWADLRSGKTLIRTIPVSFKVEGMRTAFVATRDLARGEVLRPDDFEWRDVNIIGAVSDPVISFPPESRLRESLAQGGFLRKGLAERIPPVERGANVRIETSTGGIHIEASGLALSDGEIGQPIRVRRPGSGGPFWAVVAGRATVRMRED